MAATLKRSFVAHVGSVVSTAVQAAKNAKAEEQSRMEADFQAAIADGNMSYDAQLAFRQKQLAEENSSAFKDPDYVSTLEQSVGNIKRLNRFSKYRAKYQESLAKLNAGKETAARHLSILQSQLGFAADPELRQEILQNISSAQTDVKAYDDTVLANQVKKAQYDGTTKVLGDAISNVRDRMSLARLNGNEEEASALDVTLEVLKQQKDKADVEDTKSSLQVESITKGLSPFQKLDALNGKIASSEDAGPITIDGTSYASTKDYWTQTRDAYLSGAGTGLFANFFDETKSAYQDRIDTAVARDGFATSATLDGIKADVDLIRSKPEFAPYAAQVDNLGATSEAAAFQTTAQKILDTASYTGDFATADKALVDYGSRFGVNVDAYRMTLGNALASGINSAAGARGETRTAAQIAADEGVANVAPTDAFSIPTLPVAQAAATAAAGAATPNVPSPAATAHVVAAGDTLSKIAADNGITLQKLLELNPRYRTNPNLIRAGESVNVSAAPPAEQAPTAPVPAEPVVKPTVPADQSAELRAQEALRAESAAIASGDKSAARAATSAFVPASVPPAPAPMATPSFTFRNGLTDAQKMGITALSKKTGVWSAEDRTNWNYATNNSSLPPGATM